MRRAEKEWLSYVRSAYRLLPGYRTTRELTSAILVGSQDTLAQIPRKYHEKCFYVPENAVDPARFAHEVGSHAGGPLRVAFVGRLVPYKGADILLEAAAPLIRSAKLSIDVFGDGPEMPRLRRLISQEQLAAGVVLHGWVRHTELHNHLRRAQVFAFPSIREFGGAVVLEAMALGLVPVVVDYAGPGELVTDDTGYRVPLAPRNELVLRFRDILERLTQQPLALHTVGLNARQRTLKHFTWEAKAKQVTSVYRWVLEAGTKPKFYGAP